MGVSYSHAVNWLTVHYIYKSKKLIRTYRQQLSDLCGLKSLLLVAISVSKLANVLSPPFDSRIFLPIILALFLILEPSRLFSRIIPE